MRHEAAAERPRATLPRENHIKTRRWIVSRPRLVMADDHTLVLEGFRRILEPEFDLVGTAEDGQTLVNLAVELQPDAVLLDISMPVLNGFEAGPPIRQLAPSIQLIFVSIH